MTDPFKKFKRWFSFAKSKSIQDPTAFALATVDRKNQPHVRMVLLKEITKNGFIFFTNLNSKKGKHFLENNKLSMCFYWHSINRQIRIVGKGRVIPERQSDKYFSSRLRGSQIGAWASDQSSVIVSKEDLIQKIRYHKKEFKDKLVPRPKYWNGIEIVATEFEFWKQGGFRIHSREIFYLKSKLWKTKLLSP
tara:strand:+ start:629 stop:1204 length:576 start_codon:yes stop_codon:yes gene_type:complete